MFRWLLHLPDLLARLDHLPSCFTAERKHKSISAHATRLLETRRYEEHLPQQVPSHEIMALQDADMFHSGAYLLKPRAAKPKELAIISDFMGGACKDCKEAKVSISAKLSNEAIATPMMLWFLLARGLANWPSETSCVSGAAPMPLWCRFGPLQPWKQESSVPDARFHPKQDSYHSATFCTHCHTGSWTTKKPLSYCLTKCTARFDKLLWKNTCTVYQLLLALRASCCSMKLYCLACSSDNHVCSITSPKFPVPSLPFSSTAMRSCVSFVHHEVDSTPTIANLARHHQQTCTAPVHCP